MALIIAACGGGGGGDDGGDDGGGDPGDSTGTASLSGRLLVPSYVVTDSDVNDIETTWVPNHPSGNAQSVPNPVNIGGYVNVAGAGVSGNSSSSGDRDDYFLASLTAGQTLLLNIGDLESADLDLFLYDSNGNQVDLSIGVDKFESIVVPADGQYYINVYAYSGASNYLLSVGLTPASALPPGALRLSDDFVPGDVLAKFNETSSVQARSVDPTLSQFNFPQGAGNSIGVQKLTLNSNRVSVAAKSIMPTGMSAEQQLKYDTLMAIKKLRARGDVVFAEPNYMVQPTAVPNDEHYSLQWHYSQINLPQTWDITTGSNDVIVSVIDTGILFNHPDTPARLVYGYDFISSTDISGDGDGIDNNPEDVGDSVQAGNASSFHGTHVAGTVSANSNNSIGVAGVAWNVSVMPIRVLGIGGGSTYDVAQGILYSAGLGNDSGTTPTQRADIINMSLGGGSANQTSQDAITAARNAGVIIIAAAGNENTSTLSYPASYPGVVSVSAVDMNRQRAPYSNYGTEVDIAAPGGDTQADINGDGYSDGVLSIIADDSQSPQQYVYSFYQGTSMASPHVAGVAALMKSVYSGLTPAEFDSMLSGGELTTDIGNAGRDDLYGYGLVDAFKAVQAAQQRGGGGTPTDPTLSVNPRTLNFSSTLQSATLYVEALGGDVGTVTVSENIAWLSVSTGQVDASGLGSYTLNVDRTGLAPATYSGVVQVSSATSTVNVDVIMQVSDTSITGDAGRHYILLINNANNTALLQYAVEAEGSTANYSFTNVPAGDYLVVAGSDMDMDNLICDAGESCGAYPTLSQPNVITVGSSSISNLDFTTSFEYQSPTGASSSDETYPVMIYPRESAE
ncbi:MAG: S8 family peptidase [Candidatus Thiodiazotropha sp.]